MNKRWASVVLFVAACCVALVAAEALVRVFAPHSRDHVVPGGLFTTDTTLGWALMPGRNLHHHTRYFDVRYDINSMGFRDPHRQIVRLSGMQRVLVFGDSQIFGWGVEHGHRLSDLIESRLPAVELWNMAVPGYGLDQQVLSYENAAAPLKPDVVVLFVSGPTLERTRRAHIYRKPKPRFVVDADDSVRLVPVSGRSNSRTGAVYRALSPLYLPYFLERQWQILTDPGKLPVTASEKVSARSARTIGPLPLALLQRAKSAATDGDARLAVLSDLPAAATDQLRNFCEVNGIDFLAIPFTKTSRDVFGPDEQHWNRRGNALIAERMAAMVSRWSLPDSGMAGDVSFP
ncbi:MAG: SGNH/GDSL hydrolase family protein [Gemmatimonadaceae bacterium]|nr:SGNH/GDSL hydrolase family protein [Gemmatimonadaceae bacterium]